MTCSVITQHGCKQLARAPHTLHGHDLQDQRQGESWSARHCWKNQQAQQPNFVWLRCVRARLCQTASHIYLTNCRRVFASMSMANPGWYGTEQCGGLASFNIFQTCPCKADRKTYILKVLVGGTSYSMEALHTFIWCPASLSSGRIHDGATETARKRLVGVVNTSVFKGSMSLDTWIIMDSSQLI